MNPNFIDLEVKRNTLNCTVSGGHLSLSAGYAREEREGERGKAKEN